MNRDRNVPFLSRFNIEAEYILDTNTKKLNVIIALLIGLLTILLLLATSREIGITWDEPTYIFASESQVSWFQTLVAQPGFAISKNGIDQYWDYEYEYPPFDLVWSGFGWFVSKGMLDDLTAHRLGNMILAGILAGLLYFFIAKHYGPLAGLVASAALITMPRFFFHAHLAALDVPVTVMIFACCVLYVETVHKPGFIWTLLLGILFGLALATKINAWIILPILLLIWTIIFQKCRKFLITRMFIFGCIGLILHIIIWPWLYYNPINRLYRYLTFMTVSHYKITQYFHGVLVSPPNWYFPFVMTLMVVPLSLTILYFLGSFRAIAMGRRDSISWLLIFGALLSLAIFSLGKTQVFDDERLFMTSFPFLAGLAGIGFKWLIDILKRFLSTGTKKIVYQSISFIIICIIFLPHILFAYQLYPHLLSYYSELVGGLPGATLLGMETTYWCETYKDSLDFLNKNAPPGASIWVEGYDTMLYYQLHGKLRSDLIIAGGKDPKPVYNKIKISDMTIDQADFAVVQYRQSGFYKPIQNWLNGRKPAFEVEKNGIRLMGIFKH